MHSVSVTPTHSSLYHSISTILAERESADRLGAIITCRLTREAQRAVDCSCFLFGKSFVGQKSGSVEKSIFVSCRNFVLGLSERKTRFLLFREKPSLVFRKTRTRACVVSFFLSFTHSS